MTESETKKQLLLMLKSRTIGSVLHLLSELFGELARQSMRRANVKKQKQQLEVAATLFVTWALVLMQLAFVNRIR